MGSSDDQVGEAAAKRRREAHLRRRAAGMGLALQKSRTRDAERMDYGLYRIYDPERQYVLTGGFPFGHSLDLDAVEAVLDEIEAVQEDDEIRRQWEAVHGAGAAGRVIRER